MNPQTYDAGRKIWIEQADGKYIAVAINEVKENGK